MRSERHPFSQATTSQASKGWSIITSNISININDQFVLREGGMQLAMSFTNPASTPVWTDSVLSPQILEILDVQDMK